MKRKDIRHDLQRLSNALQEFADTKGYRVVSGVYEGNEYRDTWIVRKGRHTFTVRVSMEKPQRRPECEHTSGPSCAFCERAEAIEAQRDCGDV